VVRNGKSTAGHQRYLCSHCRKTWQLGGVGYQFLYKGDQIYITNSHGSTIETVK
jgi:transposase-like protein